MMKNRINFIIDALLFFTLSLMAGLGFLIEWTLIPGRRIPEVYNANVELYLWGLDRHQWGTIHLIVAFVFLFLIVLHIILHLKPIRSMYRKLIQNQKVRGMVSAFFLILSLICIVFAFIVHIDVVPFERGQGRHGEHYIETSPPETTADADPSSEMPRVRGSEDSAPDRTAVNRSPDVEKAAASDADARPRRRATAQDDAERHSRNESEHIVGIEINGTMSLAEVCRSYDIPLDSLKRFLGVPRHTSSGERLGRLRRIYDFYMSDIEQYIDSYHKK